MSAKIKNARVVYDVVCPVCPAELIYQSAETVRGIKSEHLSIGHCTNCGTRVSIDYDKAKNVVVATVKELKDVK
ncbi:hypothetical protein [Psychrobacter sp. AT9]|uniref:hypothetical protein n=1 Tax=Psychrobacter sp. AT9 TaxID=3242893 RepID=UPI0039A49DD8